MSQALHDFQNLTALESQVLRFFFAVRSVNNGEDAHGLRGVRMHRQTVQSVQCIQ